MHKRGDRAKQIELTMNWAKETGQSTKSTGAKEAGKKLAPKKQTPRKQG